MIKPELLYVEEKHIHVYCADYVRKELVVVSSLWQPRSQTEVTRSLRTLSLTFISSFLLLLFVFQ